MKDRGLRRSCLNTGRATAALAVANPVKIDPPTRLAFVRRRFETMGTPAGQAGIVNKGNLRGLPAPRFVGQEPHRHLSLALWSREHRRGVFWETVSFLAMWLSGLAGIAIALL